MRELPPPPLRVEDWSEATVHRYLSTYRPGRISRSAILAFGFRNGAELAKYQGEDDFIKEAAVLAVKDGVMCWQHCVDDGAGAAAAAASALFNASELEQALLVNSAPGQGDDDDDGDEIDGKFPPLCERPSPAVGLFLAAVALALVLSCTVFAPELAEYFDEPSTKDFVIKFAKYASIPIGTTVFTYVHVWAALLLTFYPLRFSPACFYQIPGTNVGFPFGWQGIIPFKGDEMARMAVRMIKQHLLTVDEVFGKLDAKRMGDIIRPALEVKMARILDEVFAEEAPALWSLVPAAVKREIVQRAVKDSPRAVEQMLLKMRPEIESLLDLEHLVVDVLVSDLNLCVDVFVVCGHKELAFIKNIGAVMGFVLGLAQMAVWFFYKRAWFLPVVGCVAGALTNWLALLLIFWPLYPVRLPCGLGHVQGRFLMRQREVSKAYGKLVNRHVLKVENIVKELLFGGQRARVTEIVRESVYASVDDALCGLPVALINSAGSMAARVEMVKDRVSCKIDAEMYDLMMEAEQYMSDMFDLEYTLEFRMSRLEPSKFESLLHPIFQAEEWKLVLLGGVVGLAFGVLQVTLVGQ